MTEWKKVESNSGEFWKPSKEGEAVEGIVKGELNGDYGRQLKILQKDNKEVITPSHAILQNQLSEVKTGDDVRIVFIGTKPTPKGEAKNYEVFTK